MFGFCFDCCERTDTADAIERCKIIAEIRKMRAPGACLPMPVKWRELVIEALENA